MNRDIKNLMKKLLVVLLAVLMIMTLVPAFIFAADDEDAETTDDSSTKKAEVQTKAFVDTEASLNSIQAGSAVVFSTSTSQLVYALHEDRKVQPGSLTKLMTAMIVIDNMHSDKEYKTKIDITADAHSKDSSLPKAGKSMKLEDLLKHMLVNNSDAAAELLAKYSASSNDTFVKEMNSKAIAIGLLNTQFANVTGAYSDEQYSSAYDCAVIAQYALRYERVKNLLNETTDDSKYKYSIASIKGELSKPSESTQYLGLAVHKDMELAVVMLDANEETRASEAKRLFKYGYKNVSMNTIVKANKKVGKARVRHGASTRVNAYTSTKGYAYIPPEGSSDLVKTEVVMDANLSAPLAKGSKIGEYKIYVADELKGTVDLVTNKDVKTGWFPSYLYISNFACIMVLVIILLILLLFLRIARIKRRKKKERERKRREKIRQEAERQLAIEEDRRKRGWTTYQ